MHVLFCALDKVGNSPLELGPQQALSLQNGNVQATPLLLHVQRVVARWHLDVARLRRAL